MYRGTTPRITIEITDDILASTIKDAFITFEQPRKRVEFTKSGRDIRREDNKFVTTLTQNDTLSLYPNLEVMIQLKLLVEHEVDGEREQLVLASPIFEEEVYDALLDRTVG